MRLSQHGFSGGRLGKVLHVCFSRDLWPAGEELPRAPGDEARKIKGELFTLCCSFNSICSRVQMALLPEV